MNPCTTHKPEDSIAAHHAEAIEWRRELHRNPQPAWLEFFATAFIAEKLSEWGYDLLLGKDVVAADQRLVLPDPETLEAEWNRALGAGAMEKFLAPARGGFTGVVAVLRGSSPGPTVGFRFDIDSNEAFESSEPSHRPAAEGFLSGNPGYAHMCGHDGHIATGLLLARHFAENRDKIEGAVKFLFQPNEENMGGARAMVEHGILDDVDCLLGAHVGINLKKTGQICLNVNSFLAVSRFEVTYKGVTAHASLSPNEGKNALLAACAAVTNLYAIARHNDGASRINVGVFRAGTTWNIIPGQAYFQMETRGVTSQINEYMVRKAKEVLEGAARMYDLEVEIKPAAFALSGENSPELVELGTKVAEALPSVEEIVPESAFNASEDVTVMMEHVQRRGGKALFALFGTPICGGHHTSTFDIDERVIRNGAEFLAAMYAAVLKKA